MLKPRTSPFGLRWSLFVQWGLSPNSNVPVTSMLKEKPSWYVRIFLLPNLSLQRKIIQARKVQRKQYRSLCRILSEETKQLSVYDWLPAHDPTHLRNHLQQNFRKQMLCQVTTGKQKVFNYI